jgi:hypothetical protein
MTIPMRVSACLPLLALLAGTLVPAVAQEAQPKPPYGSAWELVQGEHDGNRDGKVSRQEYDRGAERFARLDRDGNGFLTEEDFTAQGRGGRGGRSGGAMQQGPLLARLLGLRGEIPRGALATWFSKLDGNGDGLVVEAEFGGRLPARLGTLAIRAFDANDDGRLALVELQRGFDAADADRDGKLAGPELRPGAASGTSRAAGAGTAAPLVGGIAPDFKLKLQDGKTTATLSAHRGKRPVALIFGSYT